ncbi:MAG TPA: hypothetical protein VMS29_04805 [Pyrinomonadaceae bacterium]|jgi:phage gp45-like|nr:hypothetical protein [Pyrinomonadaceae bacterium]
MHEFEIRSMVEKNSSLEARVAKLEAYQAYRRHFLSLNEGEVIIKTKNGLAKIVIKGNGDINIDCNNFEVKASGRITLKASGPVDIKGSKINQN